MKGGLIAPDGGLIICLQELTLQLFSTFMLSTFLDEEKFRTMMHGNVGMIVLLRCTAGIILQTNQIKWKLTALASPISVTCQHKFSNPPKEMVFDLVKDGKQLKLIRKISRNC